MTQAIPTPEGCQFTLDATGELWRWRMTMPDGATVGGYAPDQFSARRSAAFAAFAATSLARARSRSV